MNGLVALNSFGLPACLDVPDYNGGIGGTSEGASIRRIGKRTGELRSGFSGLESEEQSKSKRIPDLHSFPSPYGYKLTTR